MPSRRPPDLNHLVAEMLAVSDRICGVMSSPSLLDTSASELFHRNPPTKEGSFACASQQPCYEYCQLRADEGKVFVMQSAPVKKAALFVHCGMP